MAPIAAGTRRKQPSRDDEQAEREHLELARCLARAEQMAAVGQLAAGIAHDVSNYLAAITGPLDQVQRALADGSASVEAIRQDVATAVLAAADAAQSVRRLLRVVRPTGESEPDDRRRLHLDSLLPDVLALARPQWRSGGAAKERRIVVVLAPGNAPAILASAAELREALVNLVHNAMDALPAGGTITLATAGETAPDGAAYALATVTDTGIGMDATTQQRLYEPFYTTKPPGEGTGMGLAMVHSTVGRHGGDIKVRSTPGLGTSITLRFPALAADDGAVQPPAAVAPVSRPLRLLLVEDEATIRDVATRLLLRDGHLVTAVESAEAALDLLNGRTGAGLYDVLVTDVGLPGMSGLQLIEALQALRPTLAIVVASGWGHSVSSAELTRCGLRREQVVAKPYQVEALRQALEAALIGLSS